MCRRHLQPEQAVAAVLGPDRLALMQERLQLGGRQLSLVEPLDVDAVMDMYIRQGKATVWVEGPGICSSKKHINREEVPPTHLPVQKQEKSVSRECLKAVRSKSCASSSPYAIHN